MIIQVTYARLYNTGNYENIKFEAVATVENDDVAAAFSEATTAVHSQYEAWKAEKEAADQRMRDEWEAEQQRRREAAQARRSIPNDFS
jgi:hypothetical protein